MMTGSNLEDAFRNAFRYHPAGVALLTAQSDSGPVAMTVSSLISISSSPPTVGFSLSARSGSSSAFLHARTCVIHLLRYADLPLARLGATPGADRFGEGVRWRALPTGEPNYTDISTWFRARIVGTLPVEGATLVAAELIEGAFGDHVGTIEAESLIYLDRRWHRLHQENNGQPNSHWIVDRDSADVWL